MVDTNPPARGFQRPSDFGSDFARTNFQILAALARISTVTLVQVKAVDEAAGTVDVLPMVNQVDGFGNGIANTHLVYGLPYFQLMSGASAVIIAPTVGDIGVAAFADRDISKVKATHAQANPGSARTFDMADGIYFGGMPWTTPAQYVQFDASGITIHSPNVVTLEAPSIVLSGLTVAVDAATSVTMTTQNFIVNGATTLNGSLSQGTGTGGGSATLLGPLIVTNDVTAQGTSLHAHTHGGVTTGGGNTGAPN